MNNILNRCKLVFEGKGINLFTFDWCELVFEGKNKEYGAYELRQYSNKRHFVALVSVLTVAVFVFFLPSLIQLVTPQADKEKYEEVTKLTEFKEVEVIEEQKIEPELPPPPPLKSSLKFTDPVIVKDKVPDEEQVTMEELTKSEVVISNENVKGTDEKEGKLKSELDDIAQKEEVFDYVEQMPEFPGGTKAMYAHIAKNMKYPTAAQEGGIKGTVRVRFVVSKAGEITRVEVLKGVHSLLDQEAVRVIQSMPKWIPGRQNGVAVSVSFVVPVKFDLQ